jgi:ribosomal protein S18 acetylase RimI-like enzyme
VDERLTIIELEDDALLTAVLEPQRRWSAYALCDLEPPHRQYARFIGARRNGVLRTVVLVYRPPGFTSVLPCGRSEDVAAILAATEGLPLSALLIVQQGNRAAAETRYRIDESWTMLRMVVQPETIRPAPGVEATVVALNRDHLSEVSRFYASWPDTVFTPFMFEHGVYFGAYVQGELVAVAGTHALSTRHQIGVIGNVFTDPDHRGKGLATAVTGAVARELFARGARDVALNAREDNLPAIAAYRRIGFQIEEPFWEASAQLRD